MNQVFATESFRGCSVEPQPSPSVHPRSQQAIKQVIARAMHQSSVQWKVSFARTNLGEVASYRVGEEAANVAIPVGTSRRAVAHPGAHLLPQRVPVGRGVTWASRLRQNISGTTTNWAISGTNKPIRPSLIGQTSRTYSKYARSTYCAGTHLTSKRRRISAAQCSCCGRA